MAAPLTKFRDKGLSVSIFPTNNGGYTASLGKSYKKKDSDVWVNLPSKEQPYLSLFKDEIARFKELLTQAEAWMEGGEKVELPPIDSDDLPF